MLREKVREVSEESRIAPSIPGGPFCIIIVLFVGKGIIRIFFQVYH